MSTETAPIRMRYVSGDGTVIPDGKYNRREPGIDTITLQINNGTWRHQWQLVSRKWWQRLLAIPPQTPLGSMGGMEREMD